MAVFSGKKGKVYWDGSLVPHARTWNMSEGGQINAYSDSSTQGRTGRTAGIGDRTGTFTVYGDSAAEALAAAGISFGAKATLKLVEFTTNVEHEGGAIITNIERAIEIETGTQVGYTVSWGEDIETGGWGDEE